MKYNVYNFFVVAIFLLFLTMTALINCISVKVNGLEQEVDSLQNIVEKQQYEQRD